MFIAHSSLSESRDRNRSDPAAESALEQMKINLRCGAKLVGAALRAAVPCFDRGFDIAPDDSGSHIQSVSTELVMLSRAATADENDFSLAIHRMHQGIAEHRFPL